MIVMVATKRPERKALKSRDVVIEMYFEFQLPLERMTDKAKAPPTSKKRERPKTWKRRPAIMMLRPMSFIDWVSDEEAIAPPAACRSKQMKSIVQKMSVYVRGLK